MSSTPREEIRGHETVAFVGISDERDEGGASLAMAIHDAALQAAKSFAGHPIRIVHIEFTAANPHITQYKVVGTPI